MASKKRSAPTALIGDTNRPKITHAKPRGGGAADASVADAPDTAAPTPVQVRAPATANNAASDVIEHMFTMLTLAELKKTMQHVCRAWRKSANHERHDRPVRTEKKRRAEQKKYIEQLTDQLHLDDFRMVRNACKHIATLTNQADAEWNIAADLDNGKVLIPRILDLMVNSRTIFANDLTAVDPRQHRIVRDACISWAHFFLENVECDERFTSVRAQVFDAMMVMLNAFPLDALVNDMCTWAIRDMAICDLVNSTCVVLHNPTAYAWLLAAIHKVTVTEYIMNSFDNEVLRVGVLLDIIDHLVPQIPIPADLSRYTPLISHLGRLLPLARTKASLLGDILDVFKTFLRTIGVDEDVINVQSGISEGNEGGEGAEPPQTPPSTTATGAASTGGVGGGGAPSAPSAPSSFSFLPIPELVGLLTHHDADIVKRVLWIFHGLALDPARHPMFDRSVLLGVLACTNQSLPSTHKRMSSVAGNLLLTLCAQNHPSLRHDLASLVMNSSWVHFVMFLSASGGVIPGDLMRVCFMINRCSNEVLHGVLNRNKLASRFYTALQNHYYSADQEIRILECITGILDRKKPEYKTALAIKEGIVPLFLQSRSDQPTRRALATRLLDSLW